MKRYPVVRLSTLLKNKRSPVYELREILEPKYTFEVSSAYNYTPPKKHKPTEYLIFARVEDKKSTSQVGMPIKIIAGRKVKTVYPGRRVSTKELNKILRKLSPETGFIRASYDASRTGQKLFPNYFKFRFSLKV